MNLEKMRVFLFDYKRVFPLVGVLKPVVSMVVCFDNERCFTLCLPQGTWSWALATHFNYCLNSCTFSFFKNTYTSYLRFFFTIPNLFSLNILA